MAEQRFTNVFRESIWEVYRKKCFYCGNELLLLNMEIDHVLPELLAEKYEKRLEVLKQLGISETFNIRGFENLVLSCSTCNSKKGETLLPAGSLAIHLAIVRDKIPDLEEALQKQRVARDLDNMLRLIQRSVDQGKFTPEELKRGLDFLLRMPDGIKGSSPSAPPRSPEVSSLNMDIERPARMVFTDHAIKQMQQRNLGIRDIYQLIYRGISSSTANMKRESSGQYIVRGKDGLRIAYKFDDDTTVILSIVDKKSQTKA